jgi:diguanylate cyclase (GGDEF)-like protein
MRATQIFLVFLGLVVGSSRLLGQEYVFRSYRQADGLGNLSVTALTQDAAGYLWIGTENGLYRFDGASFRRFGQYEGLAESYVSALHVDKAGRVWVGTTEGLYVWQADRFVSIHADGVNMPVWQGQHISSLDPDHVMVVSKNRLFLLNVDHRTDSWSSKEFFSTAEIAAHPELGAIISIEAAPDGDLWMGCQKHLCHFSSGNLEIWGTARGVPGELWKSLLRDSRGALWARGEHHVHELQAGKVNVADRSFGVGRSGMVHLFSPLVEDKEARILTHSDGGILRWSGQHWESIGASNGFSGGAVTALLVDREGEVWGGTAGLGLVHWVGYRNWENWTTRQGAPSDGIWSFLRDRAGSFHFGTDSGQARLEAGHHRITVWPGHLKDAREQVGSLAEDRNGGVWVGTFSGRLLYTSPGTTQEVLIAKLPLIFRIFRDQAGNLWICTQEGIYLISEPGPYARPQKIQEATRLLGSPWISVPNGCESTAGTIWFVTDKGLLRFRSGHWSMPGVNNVPAPGRFSLISCGSNRALWVAGQTPGLWNLVENGEQLEATRISLPDAVRNLMLLSLQEDRRGWLWIGTDDGILVGNRRKQRWIHLGEASGLIWNDSNQNALLEDPDGSIWIGTSRGLSHVQSPETLFETLTPRVAVTDASRAGKRLPVAHAFRLPWSTASLQFDLAGTNFREREAQFYRYRLVGLEEDWLETPNPEVRFAALPAGRYRLEVAVENRALEAQSTLATVDFEILPPWWRTPWFYIGCVFLTLELFFLLYRWHVRYLIEEKWQLEQKVRLRTRELQESNQKLETLATHDGLTNLWNRSAIMEILARELGRCQREGSTLTVVLADLDHFKRINDTYGHLGGDAVLQEVATRFKAGIRFYDFIGRYGGEELLLVLPGLSFAEAEARVAILHRDISASAVAIHPENSISVTCSFGVAWVSVEPPTLTQILQAADAALYRAKLLGRNRIEFAERTKLYEEIQH